MSPSIDDQNENVDLNGALIKCFVCLIKQKSCIAISCSLLTTRTTSFSLVEVLVPLDDNDIMLLLIAVTYSSVNEWFANLVTIATLD